MPSKKVPLVYLGLAFILLTAFIFRWRAARHDYISQWDEAYHALVAKNLTKHPLTPSLYDFPLRHHDFRDWTESSIWLHKPPVPFWLMAVAIWIGGDEEFVFRLPSVALGVGTVLLLFLLARKLFPERGTLGGWIAGLLFAINPLSIRLTSGTIPTDHVDTSLVFFVTLALYVTIRAYRHPSNRLWLLSGVIIGIGYLCKSWPAMIAFLAGVPLLLKTGEKLPASLSRLAWVLGGFLAAVAPWNIYCFLRWPAEYQWEMSYNSLKHLFTAVEGHGQPGEWYFRLLPDHYGGIGVLTCLILLASFIGVFGSFYVRKDKGYLVLLLWAFVPYLVFSFTQTKMYSYMAPAVPGVLLIVGIAAADIRRYRKPWAVIAGGILLAAYVFPAVWQRAQADYNVPVWNELYDYASFRTAFRNLADEKGRKVVFNVADRKQPQAMYYGDCTAYADLPSIPELIQVAEAGWVVYVVVPDAAPDGSAWIQQVALQGGWNKIRRIPVKTGPQKVLKDPYKN